MPGKGALSLLLLVASVTLTKCVSASKPNLLLVLVDDQDATLNSTHPRYMPSLNKHIIAKGVTLSNYFVNTPVCCPSRATLLTGRHAHNTNFTDVVPPYGGYSYWQAAGLDREGTLPQWMSALGYNTYYSGKLFVEYTPFNCDPPPAGWTDIDALTLPHTFDYYHPAFSRNGAPPVAFPGQYTTDVVASKALAQLKTAAAQAKQGKPFFLQVAPVAPHDTAIVKPGGEFITTPPVPAERHAKLYPDVVLPRYADFNETDAGKPAFLRALPPLTLANSTFMDHYYRQRLRSLKAVDELVESLVTELEKQGLLDNTYIIYTGDNGYHIGAYRQGAGKETAYESDIRVPFFIRGPGLKQGVVNPGFGSHVDLAATLVTLAGGEVPAISDGQPLPLHASAESGKSFVKPAQPYDNTPIEFWGEWLDQLTQHVQFNFSYKAVRGDFGNNRVFTYTVWCSGEHELYDLTHDPLSLNNLLAPGFTSPHYSAKDIKRFADRLDALLSAWYSCAGSAQCVAPIKRVLPEASTLADTLDPKHDAFFAKLTKFGYKTCLGWYLPSNEFGAFDKTLKPTKTRQTDWSASPFALGIAAIRANIAKGMHTRRLASTVDYRVDATTVVAPIEAHAVPIDPNTLFKHSRQVMEAMKERHWTVR